MHAFVKIYNTSILFHSKINHMLLITFIILYIALNLYIYIFLLPHSYPHISSQRLNQIHALIYISDIILWHVLLEGPNNYNCTTKAIKTPALNQLDIFND